MEIESAGFATCAAPSQRNSAPLPQGSISKLCMGCLYVTGRGMPHSGLRICVAFSLDLGHCRFSPAALVRVALSLDLGLPAFFGWLLILQAFLHCCTPAEERHSLPQGSEALSPQQLSSMCRLFTGFGTLLPVDGKQSEVRLESGVTNCPLLRLPTSRWKIWNVFMLRIS